MALRFIDGFDAYAATADFLKKWSANASTFAYGASAGKFGGVAVVAAPGTVGSLSSLPGLLSGVTVRGGFWFKASAVPGSTAASTSAILSFMDASAVDVPGVTSLNSQIGIAAGGVLGMRTWRNSSTNYGITGTTNICDNVFHWIEFYILFSATGSGRLVVYVDGVEEINATQGTAVSVAPELDRFSLRNASSTATYTIDDLVIYDDAAGVAGDLVAGSFPLGPCKIERLAPTADTAQKDFARSAGADNYALVDELVPNGDSDYVEATGDGDRDLYTFGNLATTPASIHAVVVNLSAKNPDAGALNLKAVTNSNATVGVGAAALVPTSYRTLQTNFGQDPDTAAGWDAAGVNAAEFGMEVGV